MPQCVASRGRRSGGRVSEPFVMKFYRLVDRIPELVDGKAWAAWYENFESRQVAETKLGNARVITDFLGIPDPHFPSGEILFETVVQGGPFDGESARCMTWTEAEAQHAAMVDRIRRSS